MLRHPPAIQLAGHRRGHRKYPVVIFAHPHRHPLAPVGRLCSGGGRRLDRLSTLGITCCDACTTGRGDCIGAFVTWRGVDCCESDDGIMIGGITTRFR